MVRTLLLMSITCLQAWSAQAQSTEAKGPPLEIYVQGTALSPGPAYQSNYGGVRIDPRWNPKLTGGLKGDLGVYRSRGRNFVTFMVGPEFSTLERERVGWFCHMLFGMAHGSVNDEPVKTGFATAWGGGLDFRLTEHIVFRPVEAEFTLVNARFGVRISSGFGYRFRK